MELKRQTYAGNKRPHEPRRSTQKSNLNCLYGRKGKNGTRGTQDESAKTTEMRQTLDKR